MGLTELIKGAYKLVCGMVGAGPFLVPFKDVGMGIVAEASPTAEMSPFPQESVVAAWQCCSEIQALPGSRGAQWSRKETPGISGKQNPAWPAGPS